MVELSDLRSLPQLAQELELPYSSLAEWVRDGQIEATRIGHQWITTKANVYAAIHANKVRPNWRWWQTHREEFYANEYHP